MATCDKRTTTKRTNFSIVQWFWTAEIDNRDRGIV